MEILVPIGAVISFIGLIGLVICIVRASRLKNKGLTGDEMAEGLRPLVAINLAAMAFSVIGLMLVILGLSLG